ncbi:Uncharacterized protein HZ326_2509 [Fusarium oxysporum f. sp. albedinis]|nr:Uncharacterized protein HZ326_2509 [Fusarium oxysporum f. sp. albedinis]
MAPRKTHLSAHSPDRMGTDHGRHLPPIRFLLRLTSGLAPVAQAHIYGLLPPSATSTVSFSLQLSHTHTWFYTSSLRASFLGLTNACSKRSQPSIIPAVMHLGDLHRSDSLGRNHTTPPPYRQTISYCPLALCPCTGHQRLPGPRRHILRPHLLQNHNQFKRSSLLTAKPSPRFCCLFKLGPPAPNFHFLCGLNLQRLSPEYQQSDYAIMAYPGRSSSHPAFWFSTHCNAEYTSDSGLHYISFDIHRWLLMLWPFVKKCRHRWLIGLPTPYNLIRTIDVSKKQRSADDETRIYSSYTHSCDIPSASDSTPFAKEQCLRSSEYPFFTDISCSLCGLIGTNESCTPLQVHTSISGSCGHWGLGHQKLQSSWLRSFKQYTQRCPNESKGSRLGNTFCGTGHQPSPSSISDATGWWRLGALCIYVAMVGNRVPEQVTGTVGNMADSKRSFPWGFRTSHGAVSFSSDTVLAGLISCLTALYPQSVISTSKPAGSVDRPYCCLSSQRQGISITIPSLQILLSKIDILANDPSNFHRVMVSPAYCISSARDPGKKKMLKFFCFLVKTPLSHERVVFCHSLVVVCPNMSLLKDAHSVPGIYRKRIPTTV